MTRTSQVALVVEDNPAHQKLARILLQLENFEVHLADDAVSALAKLPALSPDVVLIDIQLPGMDGLELCRRLRERPELMAVPMVAVTAYAMVQDRERYLAAGFDGYIAKPIDQASFVVQVRGFMAAKAGLAG